MTFPGMSTGHPYTVGSFPEGGQDKFWAYPSGTRYPDHPYVGGVLHSADPCKVCSAIAAPVAEKCHDLSFFFSHYRSPFHIKMGSGFPIDSILSSWFMPVNTDKT